MDPSCSRDPGSTTTDTTPLEGVVVKDGCLVGASVWSSLGSRETDGRRSARNGHGRHTPPVPAETKTPLSSLKTRQRLPPRPPSPGTWRSMTGSCNPTSPDSRRLGTGRKTLSTGAERREARPTRETFCPYQTLSIPSPSHRGWVFPRTTTCSTPPLFPMSVLRSGVLPRK